MKKFLKLSGIVFFIFFLMIQNGLSGNEKTPIGFENDDTLEQIREKIIQNRYDFKVSHNWVFDLSPEQKAVFFSRRPSEKTPFLSASDDIGPVAFHIGKKTLPSKFDWRNHNGHSYIGNIRDQGYCGSCYAFGAAAAAEGTYNFAMGRFDSNCIDFSESFIMWCLGSLPEYYPHFFGCYGADYDYMELQALVDHGIVKESDFPYTTIDPGDCTHWGDPAVKFFKWYRIPCSDIEAIKTAIMNYGVVDAAVMVSSAFEAYDSGVYQDSNTTCYASPCYYTPTNHAVSLVGWDDSSGSFILRNSWGSSWGENGYMRIKYDSAIVSCEVCYLVISDIVLQLSVSREDLNIWVFNEQYADIELTVDKKSSITVSKYIVYKKESGGSYGSIKEVLDSELESGSISFMDRDIDPAKTYTYKAVAIDSQGDVIGSSSEITI